MTHETEKEYIDRIGAKIERRIDERFRWEMERICPGISDAICDSGNSTTRHEIEERIRAGLRELAELGIEPPPRDPGLSILFTLPSISDIFGAPREEES